MRKMFQKINKKVVAAGVAVYGVSASAAITAPDFTAAGTDVGTVVGAILGFLAIVFGFRKVMSMMG